MKKRFSLNPDRTEIVLLMAGNTPEDIIAQARGAEFDGADGIALDLAFLPPEFRTVDTFRRILNEIPLPFMFLDYRNDHFLGADDDARQAGLLLAAEAGADVIDVMGDLYNPSEFELTQDPGAVRKQKTLIAEIHRLGARVLMSSHMVRTCRKAEDVLAHLRIQEERGADILKIVTGSNTEDELLENIRATMLAKRELHTPFLHLCGGATSRIHRYIGPKLGCAVTFGVHEYRPEFLLTQPTIASLKTVLANLHL